MAEAAAVRIPGVLRRRQAAARPPATVFGHDAYPDLWTKAAALLQSIVKSHALVDGNKRLAWLATAIFLEINDVSMTSIDSDAVYELVMDAARGRREVGTLAAMLGHLAGD